MHDQEGGLQAVCEGDPGQIPKDQHEAKTIMHDVHSCQYSLLIKSKNKSNKSSHKGRIAKFYGTDIWI